MKGIKILGTGLCRGDSRISNFDLAERMDTSDEWIRTKTGIVSRYYAETMTNGDMASKAARAAMISSCADEVDLVIVCTFTPDYATPSVACSVAGSLGLSDGVCCLDLNGACSGFVYGMNAAAAMLASGEFKRALVIGSERISPLLDPRERGTSVLFGDGAGAVVLESDPGGTFYMAAGTMPDEHVLYCDRFDPAIMMKGQEVYRFAVSRVPENIENLLDKASLRVSDIDMFVLHQANIRIIESIARQLGIPEGKCFVNIDRQGNTSAASIPIAIAEMDAAGMLRHGMRIVASGFGAGLTYGSMLFTF